MGFGFMVFLPAILAVSKGSDRDFIKTLYIQYHRNMFRMARSLTDSRQDAEDVVGEACVSLINRIDRLRELDPALLEGYIISTVKNSAYMLHRKNSVRREVLEEVGSADSSPLPDENLLRECTVRELTDAISRLSEGDQAVIRMKYFEKLSDREIARQLGIQAVSVRSKLMRARQKLAALMGGSPNDD